MNTPVAFIIFNRADVTERVFAEIARAKPPKLFVIADGPRSGKPDDAEKCAAARAVIDRVDWNCEVHRNFSDVNIGCGRRPATGISWVFEHTDRAIILEDDCLPDPTFFRFCDELLEKYRDDARVMHISGNNFQFGVDRGPSSYYFSRHNICAGAWATWRRAWEHFDMSMKLWPELRETPWLLYTLGNARAAEYWRKIFDEGYAHAGDTDYWDYQWTFSFWAQSGLAAVPGVELLSNIGFREDATHTKWTDCKWGNIPTKPINFPLKHPPGMVPHAEADLFYLEKVLEDFQPPDRTLRQILSSVTPRPVRKAISYVRSI